MHAFSIPGLRYSLPAGGDVALNRFVTVKNEKAVQAAADEVVIGASQTAVESDAGVAASYQVVSIATGLVVLEAAGEIASGDEVSSDKDGKAVKAVDGYVAGIAITNGATGGLVTVKI